ncbi:probable E3 ubiquitin ligase complex SCF subunit scon-2 [Frieseomelitta varia]|uniref:probable E3 ubiquitin ligase complex SCF subunit scon-2 n=1 Tax=Frieseomelitta varia TaxID=561572 RepID=UPI001CB69C76|nr:probable E3 ubiquitin ligase complex SCF subunit scon-2 [Frieseomelitta varia]
MEFFRLLLRAVGLLEPSKVDFIVELPLEVSQLILRKLDPESLLCAAQVSRKWMAVCRSDKILLDTAKNYKRSIRRKMMGKVFGLDLVAEEEMEMVRRRHVQRNTLPPKVQKTVVFAKTRESRRLPKHSKVNRSSNAKPVKCMRF